MTGRAKLAAAFTEWVDLNRWNQTKVAAMGGPSTSTQTKIRKSATTDLAARTLEQIDLVMGWDEGTSAAVLGELIDPPPPKRRGPELKQYGGPAPERPAYMPPHLAENVRRSILDDDEHSEWEVWASQMELTRRVVERLTGTGPELDERDMTNLRNAVQHQTVGTAAREAAFAVLADYIADSHRLDVHHDPRTRLLYSFAKLDGAPLFMESELERRFGEFDPNVDPSARPRTDLTHPIAGEIAVDLSDPAPGNSGGGSPLQPGRRR